MNDLISRQALCEYALNQKDKSITPNDIMRFPSAQPYTEAEIQKIQDLEQAEMLKAYECGRESVQPESCEFYDTESHFCALHRPSAQPEIIRCKDCKHHSYDAGYGYDWCNRTSGVFRVKPDDFCSRAERRTDGNGRD